MSFRQVSSIKLSQGEPWAGKCIISVFLFALRRGALGPQRCLGREFFVNFNAFRSYPGFLQSTNQDTFWLLATERNETWRSHFLNVAWKLEYLSPLSFIPVHTCTGWFILYVSDCSVWFVYMYRTAPFLPYMLASYLKIFLPQVLGFTERWWTEIFLCDVPRSGLFPLSWGRERLYDPWLLVW